MMTLLHEVPDGKEEFAITNNVKEVNATVIKLTKVLAAGKLSTQHSDSCCYLFMELKDGSSDGGWFQSNR